MGPLEAAHVLGELDAGQYLQSQDCTQHGLGMFEISKDVEVRKAFLSAASLLGLFI